MTALFYHPPPRVNSAGLTRSQVIRQVDFMGGFLSISGVILFCGALVWGGYQVRLLDSLADPHILSGARANGVAIRRYQLTLVSMRGIQPTFWLLFLSEQP